MTARTRPEQARPEGTRGFGANDAVGARSRCDRGAFERSCQVSKLSRHVSCRFVWSALLGAALLMTTLSALADDLQQFELGKTRFDRGEYDKAAERFAAMLDPAQEPCTQTPPNATAACRLTDTDVIERARALYAASLVALDRNDEAELQIAEILRKNFQFSPDPAAFPQKVVDRFTVVRGRLRQELEAAQEKRAQLELEQRVATERLRQAEERWVADIVRAASEERIVVKNSRFIAALPFGVGQFQNRKQSLGTAFVVSEALLGITTLATSQAYTYYKDIGFNPAFLAQKPTLLANQAIFLRLNQVSFAAFAAVVLTGIIQAQIAYVPEFVTVRKRQLPPRPTAAPVQVMPTVSFTKDMMGIGLSGTF